MRFSLVSVNSSSIDLRILPQLEIPSVNSFSSLVSGCIPRLEVPRVSSLRPVVSEFVPWP